MPIKQAAMKALRQNRKAAVHNIRLERNLKSALKKTRQALQDKSQDIAEAVKKTAKLLDMSAQKRIIHKNKAARLKSQLVRKLQKIKKK